MPVKLDAGVVPNSTWVAPLKFMPLIPTLAPSPAGPEVGASALTVGAVPI
jgi:hypothetical protein